MRGQSSRIALLVAILGARRGTRSHAPFVLFAVERILNEEWPSTGVQPPSARRREEANA